LLRAQLPGPVSGLVYLIFYHIGSVAESQMANTDLPCDKLSPGQVSYRKVPSMLLTPCTPVSINVFKLAIKLVSIKSKSRYQRLMHDSWQLRFQLQNPYKGFKSRKEIAIG
jgi:hypothetical protein